MAKNSSQFPDAGPITGAEFVPIWQDGVQKKVTHAVFVAGLGGGGGYTLPIATGAVLGGVKVGSGLAIDGGGILSVSYAYSLPTATGSVLGGVKVGSGLAIDGGGVLSATYSYTLPQASGGALGGVRVGAGLAIDGSGILSATAPIATETGTARTATPAQAGNYTRFTNAATKTYTFDTAQSYVVGAEYHGRNMGAGNLTLVGTGMTLNAPAGGTLVVPTNGAFTVKIVASGEADVFGVTVAL